jgi:hypothetical protein
MRASATNIGRGFGEIRALPDIEPTPAKPSPGEAQLPAIPPTPPPEAPEHPEEWADTPCIKDQAVRSPASIRYTGIITELFDLSDKTQLARYNELTSKASMKNPGIIVHKDLVERSKGKDVWHVFFQYRKVQYKKLTPQPN